MNPGSQLLFQKRFVLDHLSLINWRVAFKLPKFFLKKTTTKYKNNTPLHVFVLVGMRVVKLTVKITHVDSIHL